MRKILIITSIVLMTIAMTFIFMLMFYHHHHKHYNNDCVGCEDYKITITNPTTCSNSLCKSNGFVDPYFLIDNDDQTSAYVEMSKYNEFSEGNLYIDFFDYHTLNGINFKYSMPNTDSSDCYGNYPGPICHTYKYELSYLSDDKWIVVDSIELSHAGHGCQIVNTYYGNFDGVCSKHWRFKIIGNYWLGANYQTTTYFRIYGINFKEKCN
jgi:hypothetical protein